MQSVGEPSSFNGTFSYLIPCDGTVTSIRARGFCPARINDSAIVLTILNSTVVAVSSNITVIKAECNTSAPVGPDYYEGYVNVNNLSISVVSGGFLSVFFPGSDCLANETCLFQPAILNETRSENLFFFDRKLVRSEPEVSLLFSATIVPGALFRIDRSYILVKFVYSQMKRQQGTVILLGSLLFQ